MMGIDVDRVIAIDVLHRLGARRRRGRRCSGSSSSQIFHFMGFLAGLKGFTAAVDRRHRQHPGAMLGGLLVGLAESCATGYLPQGSTSPEPLRVRGS